MSGCVSAYRKKAVYRYDADDNSDSWWANWYDETVFANAKLIKENYQEDTSKIDFIKTIDELKNTDIPIDNDTLEIFRMFG